MKTFFAVVASMSAAWLLQAETPSAIALHNARIVTVSGPVIAQGTVLIRDGLIAGVGENLTPPPDAWVIEAQGLTVYPGLIDALSTWGIPPGAPASTSTSSRGTTAGYRQPPVFRIRGTCGAWAGGAPEHAQLGARGGSGGAG
jgi:hypothetical protein